MAEFYPEIRKDDILPVTVNIVSLFQRANLIHRRIDDAQHMGAVADRLQRTENAERKEHKHQHDRHLHAPGKAEKAGSRSQEYRCGFQRQKVSAICRGKPVFYLQPDITVLPGCFFHALHRGAALPKRFHGGKSAGIL